MRAEQRVTLASDLAALAGELELPEATATDQNEAVAAVLRHLEQAADRWLLVFDNAGHADDLRDSLPRAGGHVIVTSRNPAWHGVGRPVAVDTLPVEEAVAFLATRTGHHEPESAAALAEEMDGLPLALEQAGAYVVATGRSLAWYLGQFRAHRSELIHRGVPSAGSRQTVATTWDLAFGQIASSSPAALDLLSLCAFLAPDDMPLDILAQHAELLPEPLATTLADDLALAETIEAIRRYSLIETVDDTHISIHRLVQLVARDRLSDDERTRWLSAAVAAMDRAFLFDMNDSSTWVIYIDLLPHTETLSWIAVDLGITPDGLGRLLNQIGLFLHGRARYASAQLSLERALAVDEATSGPEHPTVATRLNNLALTLRAQGNVAGARSLIERALAIDEAVIGPDHPTVAIRLNNLALVIQDQGDLSGARSRYERALAIDEAAYGPDHPEVATDRNNLAGVLRAQGDLAGARSRYERALSISVTALDDNHPVVATRLHNLASVLQLQGDLAGARALPKRALQTRSAKLPADHPYLAQSHWSLAEVLYAAENLHGARSHFEKALAIYQLCEMTREIIAILRSLAGLIESMGQRLNAILLRRKAIGMLHRESVEPSYDEGVHFFNLGLTAEELGYSEEGLRLRALRYVVDRAIGHGDAEEHDLPAVRRAAESLG